MRSPARLAAALALVSLSTLASTPPSQTVAVPTAHGQVVVVTWEGTAPAGVFGGANTCAGAGVGEDGHIINLTVPPDLYDDFTVKADFHVEWDTDGDYVLTVLQDGNLVGDSDGGTPEENVSANDPVAGAYDAIICPFVSPTATPYRGRLTLTATSRSGGSPDLDDDGVPNEVDVCPGTPAGASVDADGCTISTASGLGPRFQIHVAPSGMGDDAAEPSIGYNKFTNRTMFISYTHALRQTYQEEVVPPLLPASCPATWEDKSGLLTTINSLDPILFTDEATGRIFNSQLTGSNSAFEFTDDDGENWTPGQIGASNGGADHQTIASGPYPAAATPPTATWPPGVPKRAVYYCSQSVAAAFCSRSDDGGQTFGPGMAFKNLDCGAGGLHGHVKVAPDGTVYVPDSSQCIAPVGGTAGQVIVHVSNDAGQTWTVHTLPESTGGAGSDPSIGIATDGTLYMCYENADSSVRMAVSKDKGVTWIRDKNIGAPLGIVQSRFPQAVAGDGGRAACAFLGTTTPGNGASLAFQGVWHGYIATTYNEGVDYHVANVTPFDPIQGFGGVGPDGTNRNLLDFNDLQIDDEGRLLFAYADGCIGGCVRDPSANGFAAKASIVRQSGGRTMFAAFDNKPLTQYNNPTPIKPAPACGRQDLSVRTSEFSRVVWNAPDTGGSKITNYRVSRATSAAGPFSVLGDAGKATTFVDTTPDPLVEKYYYKVVAQNSVGMALDSNIIELVVTILPVIDTCTAPGDIVITDPTGDASPPSDDMDIVFVGVSEPVDRADSFVFTYKVAGFTGGTPAPGAFYALLFPGNFYIGMNAANAAAPSYEYGTYAVATVTTFAKDGDLDAASGFADDGTITLVAARSLFGNPDAGDLLAGFEARARIGANTTSRDTSATTDYTVRGIDVCSAAALVLGELKASPGEGAAPLDVIFSLSGTVPEGATLDTWSITFGDEPGTPSPQTGSFGGRGSVQVSHRYLTPGVYRAKLTVSDDTGRASTNLAEQTITVLGDVAARTDGNNRIGGAIAPAVLLILGLAGLLRPRRRLHAE
ncbi:MAG TPA: PKD domain-containing protein [Verrucomicrobiae bacterium]|nr:PKD domain-containing protein [Verrucomicrobiae bacterium]